MYPSRNVSLGKYKQIRFVRANPDIDMQASVTENTSKSTICGKDVRTFYETLLTEPSTSIVPDTTVTMRLENSNRHPRKSTKLSNNISKEQDDIKKNYELFKDAANGNIRGVMDYYRRKGMDINVSDQYGWTALMCASYAGHLHIVKYLLSMGVDVSKRSRSGETAADFALKCGHREIYRHIILNEKKKSNVRCKSSLRMNKGSRKISEVTHFCDACQCSYIGKAHLSSVAHLLETRKPVFDPGYGIPEWNKGYRILRSSGWDEFKGLGRDATGRRYPIKTVLKRDKLGLGCATSDISKVTHFKANDVNAVKISLMTRGKELKNYKERILHEKIFEHRFRNVGLECALCHESYAAEIRTPRVLHGCGHTVCQTCCSALVDLSAPIAQVVCPFDRTVTLLTEPCVFSLKKNYALIEIIERHKNFTQSDRISPLLVSILHQL
ncbi:unnamed protein product [Onchocerca ochengi]|uniref:ANK_REP_REGION domain-containing protein n=1 Tax=Onchocerca ochengi TaxID=42157 RepID=A0A182EJB7_ONCOC|nr:unnamed protein product [Onchocerca ochengi]